VAWKTVIYLSITGGNGLSPVSRLSRDFILGLDLAQSVAGRVVAIAGMAGNAEDLKDLPESEQGTVSRCEMFVDGSHLRRRYGVARAHAH
jgi:hypothetical protein